MTAEYQDADARNVFERNQLNLTFKPIVDKPLSGFYDAGIFPLEVDGSELTRGNDIPFDGAERLVIVDLVLSPEEAPVLRGVPIQVPKGVYFDWPQLGGLCQTVAEFESIELGGRQAARLTSLQCEFISPSGREMWTTLGDDWARAAKG